MKINFLAKPLFMITYFSVTYTLREQVYASEVSIKVIFVVILIYLNKLKYRWSLTPYKPLWR